jgi:mono/diheme cytochrome c family protein
MIGAETAMNRNGWALACLFVSLATLASAETPVERGYRLLRSKPFLPHDLTRQQAEHLWTVWPAELRAEAEGLSPDERWTKTLEYYGLMPADDEHGPVLGYVEHRLPNGSLGWSMNCLACHGGKVNGDVMPGLPNTHYALENLVTDARTLKMLRGEPLSDMDTGALITPLGTTNGTTNAVVFGVALLDHRTPELKYSPRLWPRKYHHHDLDAPPFWNVKKKNYLYYDATVPKGPRSLLQFTLVPRNDSATIRGWEEDARDILAWIESVEPPKYPGSIDEPLAKRGEVLFRQSCSSCHGTYGDSPTYPNRVVPIDDVGTDRARYESIESQDRERFAASWFGDFGRSPVVTKPKGYIAPPLDGVWASAPYLHNGSVPTLWHVLHPDERPKVWRRSEDGYDWSRTGLEFEILDSVPAGISTAERHRYFDTTRPGKSHAGHDYPAALSEDERSAVLEYLKTL